MTIDQFALAELGDAIDRYERATRAVERRYALEAFGRRATPDIVGQLVDEYEAAAPTNADLDHLAALLRDHADALEAFGTRIPETAGANIVAVIALSGLHLRRMGMAFTLTADQQVDLSVTYQDARGNAAQVESQTWESSDDAVLAVTDNGDGTAVATAAAIGNAQVTLRADARFGDEVQEIIGTLDVNIVAAEAVTATIVPGTPTTAGGGETPTPTPDETNPPA